MNNEFYSTMVNNQVVPPSFSNSWAMSFSNLMSPDGKVVSDSFIKDMPDFMKLYNLDPILATKDMTT